LAFLFTLTALAIEVSHICGGDLHGVEKDGSLFRLDAAVEHHFANLGDCGLDGDGIFENWQVGVFGRAVVDVDLRQAHHFVKVAKPFAAESGRLAGIAVGFALFTGSVGVIIEI
jgi:hypothetical protein